MGGISLPEKALLRRELLARRDALSKRSQRSSAIQEALWAHPAYQEARKLFLYLSKGSEPDTWKILDRALAEGKEVYAPRCLDKNGSMAFYRVTCRETLAPGSFGLLEPDPLKCPPAGSAEGALCLVPGLAFDEMGYRLGYGKGYYDRFLAGYPGKTAGLCYGEMMLPALPRGPYDKRVDFVITEAGAFALRKGQEPGKEGCV